MLILFSKYGTSLEGISLIKIEWEDTMSNRRVISKNTLLNELPAIILGELCAYSLAYNLIFEENNIVGC